MHCHFRWLKTHRSSLKAGITACVLAFTVSACVATRQQAHPETVADKAETKKIPASGPAAPGKKTTTEPPESQDIERITLGNNQIRLTLTPDFGGRVLAFHTPGAGNVLKLGEAVETQPQPEISAFADNVAYLGHTVWLGPQNAWWTQQDANAERAEKKAVWPPDAYTVFAPNSIVERSDQLVELEGPPSPVWGTRMRKRFELLQAKPDSVKLTAEIKNIRDTEISWDLWFNTRVHQSAEVYVPVAREADVWLMPFLNESFAMPGFHLKQGLFSPVFTPVEAGLEGIQGKFAIQPSAGWMAAFTEGQVFIMEFPLQPKSVIHPEQGQIELFFLRNEKDPAEGLTELEIHSPYVTLQPGQTLKGHQIWRVIDYPGANTDQERRAFLKSLNMPGI